MARIDYTLVVGVDEQHLWQLSKVWPTWRKHKPDLAEVDMVVFFDKQQVREQQISDVIERKALLIEWPPPGVEYTGNPDDKWTRPQRVKMLAGFVHVPAQTVATPYWLKLDTDAVATDTPNWIHGKWFDGMPGIVCHRWGFTRPPDQMLRLDEWVEQNKSKVGLIAYKEPLRLAPEPGDDRLRHERIISWCGFFCSGLTKYCSQIARATCGEGQLPMPSQDGFMWYIAKRLGLEIVTPNMKKLGWQHWSTNRAVADRAAEALKD